MTMGGYRQMVRLQTYTLDGYIAEELTQQARQWADRPDLTAVMNAMPQVLLVLNDRRQVVFANRVAMEMAGANSLDSLLGMRPGELLECEQAREGPGGCGTTEACTQCGAFRAFAECGAGAAATNECRLIHFRTGRAMLFRVSSTPCQLGSRQ
jgi:PAS domain-containing protein